MTSQNTLIIDDVRFFELLPKLIASGVTFEAEQQGLDIKITFLGGY